MAKSRSEEAMGINKTLATLTIPNFYTNNLSANEDP